MQLSVTSPNYILCNDENTELGEMLQEDVFLYLNEKITEKDYQLLMPKRNFEWHNFTLKNMKAAANVTLFHWSIIAQIPVKISCNIIEVFWNWQRHLWKHLRCMTISKMRTQSEPGQRHVAFGCK